MHFRMTKKDWRIGSDCEDREGNAPRVAKKIRNEKTEEDCISLADRKTAIVFLKPKRTKGTRITIRLLRIQ